MAGPPLGGCQEGSTVTRWPAHEPPPGDFFIPFIFGENLLRDKWERTYRIFHKATNAWNMAREERGNAGKRFTRSYVNGSRAGLTVIKMEDESLNKFEVSGGSDNRKQKLFIANKNLGESHLVPFNVGTASLIEK